MKMKKILIYVFALLLTAPGWSREFYRLGGLKKVRIIKVTHRGILVSHTEGICNLDLKKLSAQDKKDLEKELLELQQKQQEQQEQQHERELFRKRRFQNFVKQQEAELNDFIHKVNKMSLPELRQWLVKRNLLGKSRKAFFKKYAHTSNNKEAFDALIKRITEIEDFIIEKLANQCKDKDFQSMKRFFAGKFKRKFSDDDLFPFLRRNFPNTKKIAKIAAHWNREKEKYLKEQREREEAARRARQSSTTYYSSNYQQSSRTCANCRGTGTVKRYIQGYWRVFRCNGCGGSGTAGFFSDYIENGSRRRSQFDQVMGGFMGMQSPGGIFDP